MKFDLTIQRNPDRDPSLEDAAHATAEFWVRAIENPTFDSGNGSLGGILAHTRAIERASVTVPRPDQLVAFYTRMYEFIYKRLVEYGQVTLYCDYGPGMYIGTMLQESGIAGSRVPWKTETRTTTDFLETKMGYRAELVTAWTREGYEHTIDA